MKCKPDMINIYQHLKKSDSCCYVNDIYVMINDEKTQCSSFSKGDYIQIYLIFIISIITTAGIFIINLLFEKKYNNNGKIAIARVPSEKYKINNVFKDIQFIEDDIKNLDFTVYRIGSRYARILFLFFKYLSNCINDFSDVVKILKPKDFEPYRKFVLIELVKRIPHTVIHRNAVEYVIKSNSLNVIYTGATYERFALIADKLSKKYKKKLICIPHGIETTEVVPGGYAGDLFYSSSHEMANKLNKIYETSKFVFDNDISKKMYSSYTSSNDITHKSEPKVIFFTQPTDKEFLINVIDAIANYMMLKEQKLFIRIHPRESKSDYTIENTEFIEDFQESITGNLCISLFSTVLIESIYNNSIPMSIVYLLDNKVELDGRYEFLNDDRILKPNNLDVLLSKIDMFVNDKINKEKENE